MTRILKKSKRHIWERNYYQKNKEKIKARKTAWRKANPKKVKNAWKKWESNNKENRRNKTLKIYGITEKDYLIIFEKQKGVCKICNQPQITKRLAVDHCHNTNKIRGLLCDRCNRGIGLFKDNPKTILSAYNYLQKKYAK